MTGPTVRLRAVVLATLVVGSLLTTASVGAVAAAGNAGNQPSGEAGVLVENPSSTSPVTEGETLTVTATVTNTGDAAVTRTVELEVAGAVRNTRSVSLAADESRTVSLGWQTADGDAGSYTATIASDDDAASTGVTVDAATESPTFAVSDLQAPADATVGDDITVTATVSNTGDRNGTLPVTFGVDTDSDGDLEPLADEERTLGAGETTTVSFDVDTGALAAGTYTHGVSTANDTATATITLAAADPEPGVYSFVQGDRCFEVENFGDGTRADDDFYGYDEANEFSSQGTLALQENQASNLFVYDGSEGDSLVLLHDAVGGPYGSTLTMQFSGLREDGVWEVQDDNYPGRDDDFDLGTTQADIDWKWSQDRTDDAAFRGLNETQDLAITIEPGFNEDAQFWGDWPWSGDADNRTESWHLLSSDSPSQTVTTLDRNEPVTVQAGSCADGPDDGDQDDGAQSDDTDPTAFVEAPSRVETYETFHVSGAASTDDTGIVEYRWDFDDDGKYNPISSGPIASFTYEKTGEYTVTLLVVDEDRNTDTTATTISVERENEKPTVDITGPTEVAVDENVTYEATNISDEAPIDHVCWLVDGIDGPDGETLNTSFDTTGHHNVTVVVSDAAGNTRRKTLTVSVVAGSDDGSDDSDDSEDKNDSDDSKNDGPDDTDDSDESDDSDGSDESDDSEDSKGDDSEDGSDDAKSDDSDDSTDDSEDKNDSGDSDESDDSKSDDSDDSGNDDLPVPNGGDSPSYDVGGPIGGLAGGTSVGQGDDEPVTGLRVESKTVETGTELNVSMELGDGVETGDSVTVTVTRVSAADGAEQVDSFDVDVHDGDEGAHAVPLSIDEPGSYELSAGGRTAAITVVDSTSTGGETAANTSVATPEQTPTPTSEPVTITGRAAGEESTTTTSSGSGPGFGPLAVLVALVALVALAGVAARE